MTGVRNMNAFLMEMDVQKVQFLYRVLLENMLCKEETNGPLCQLMRGGNSCRCTATISKLKVKDSLQVYSGFLGGLILTFDFNLNTVSPCITVLLLTCNFISVFEKAFQKRDGKDEEVVPGTSGSKDVGIQPGTSQMTREVGVKPETWQMFQYMATPGEKRLPLDALLAMNSQIQEVLGKT